MGQNNCAVKTPAGTSVWPMGLRAEGQREERGGEERRSVRQQRAKCSDVTKESVSLLTHVSVSARMSRNVKAHFYSFPH